MEKGLKKCKIHDSMQHVISHTQTSIFFERDYNNWYAKLTLFRRFMINILSLKGIYMQGYYDGTSTLVELAATKIIDDTLLFNIEQKDKQTDL